MIREVSLEISKKEKEAQSEIFNPFDYVRIISDLKVRLESKCNFDFTCVENIIKTGKFNFECKIEGKIKNFSINLSEDNLKLKSNRSSNLSNIDVIKKD